MVLRVVVVEINYFILARLPNFSPRYLHTSFPLLLTTVSSNLL